VGTDDRAGGTGVPPVARPGREQRPDYRDSLANERTFLAWIRTALSLIAGAVAVIQLVPPFSSMDVRWLMGVLLSSTAAATSALAYLRWSSTERCMRMGRPLPPARGLLAVSVAICVLAVGVFALAVAGRR